MPGAVEVARGVLLDCRLALFSTSERWLAVADLHYGYEVTKRHQGGLLPLWGMQTIEDRLAELVADYQPDHLIVCGDIVDGRGTARETRRLVEGLEREVPGGLVLVRGNHDAELDDSVPQLVDEFETAAFRFHHGHEEPRLARRDDGKTQVTGHLHPTVRFGDGAGLALTLPALVQEDTADRGARWVLPAFSPWAGGRNWRSYELARDSRLFACSPRGVVPAPRR